MDRNEEIRAKRSFVKMYNELELVDMDNAMISTLLLAVYILNENRKHPGEIHDIIVNSCYLAKAIEDGGNLN